MAIGPINYQALIADPFQGVDFAGIGQQIRQARDQRLKQEQAQQAAEQYRADISAAMANPSPKAFADLALKYPGQREAFKQGWETINADQQQNEIRDAGKLAAALSSGRNDVAEKLLQDRIDAMKKAGTEAPELQLLLDGVRSNPKQAYGQLLHIVSALPGGNNLLENLGRVGAEQRAQELQPAAVEKATAEAQKFGSEAAIKAVEARYAPTKIPLEIEQLGKNLSLTDAQIQQARAAARASDASAKRANAEAERVGSSLLTPEQQVDAAAKLRKEYSDQTKGFQDVREAYRRIQASDNNAVGDLSLIFGYMKMLDPGSVVREGEFANAQNAAGVPDRVLNIYNRALSGERLSQGQRKSFIAQARKLYEAAETQEKTVRTGIERIATGYGLKKENVFYDPNPKPETDSQSSSPRRITTDADFNALPSGALFIAPDGTTRRKP